MQNPEQTPDLPPDLENLKDKITDLKILDQPDNMVRFLSNRLSNVQNLGYTRDQFSFFSNSIMDEFLLSVIPKNAPKDKINQASEMLRQFLRTKCPLR